MEWVEVGNREHLIIPSNKVSPLHNQKVFEELGGTTLAGVTDGVWAQISELSKDRRGTSPGSFFFRQFPRRILRKKEQFYCRGSVSLWS